jgi:hypothetical protein
MMLPYDMRRSGTLQPAARERARVREHLVGAQRSAQRRRVRLDPLAALCRALLLDELGRYRRRGLFPLHPGGAREIPQFIDAHGTRCAVAHLMQITGQGELVRRIAETDNAASVHALARLPELGAWLAAAGLSLDEAARIQPAYCYYHEADACFCSTDWSAGQVDPSGVTGLAVGAIVALDERVIRVRVDHIGGTLPGLAVGDERELGRGLAADARGALDVGSELLLGYDSTASMSDAGAPALIRVQPQLAIDGSSVTCSYNSATANRPVSVDTALDALLAMGGGCIDILANDDSGWNQRTCDNSGLVDSQSETCNLAPASGDALATGELTSAALIVALLLYRRQRVR